MYSIVRIISINGLMITKEGNQKKSIKDGHTGILVTCLDEFCTHHFLLGLIYQSFQILQIFTMVGQTKIFINVFWTHQNINYYMYPWDRQYNGQQKKDKKSNNDIQNTTDTKGIIRGCLSKDRQYNV